MTTFDAQASNVNHIFNASAIKAKLQDKPAAQRLTRFINKDEFNVLTEDQVIELIGLVEDETRLFVEEIRRKIPYTL